MFERYTEKARRMIFFARYEASQYGNSRYIETEHLLLGFVRERRGMLAKLHSGTSEAQIRADVEKRITRGERVSTSVEMSLSEDGRTRRFCALEV